MTQEEKNLVLKEVSARIFYGVKCFTNSGAFPIFKLYYDGSVMFKTESSNGIIEFGCDIPKLYLRSITNITDEEATELGKLTGTASYNLLKTNYNSLQKLLEFVYQHHIDMFGLIDKGLALEAPKDMYNF